MRYTVDLIQLTLGGWTTLEFVHPNRQAIDHRDHPHIKYGGCAYIFIIIKHALYHRPSITKPKSVD